MTKRRVNKQQQDRIQKRQQRVQEAHHQHAHSLLHDGLIIKRDAKHALVETQKNSTLLLCSIRPAIDSLVAGDRVVWEEQGDHQGVIISRYPRASVIGRPNPQGEIKPIAANVSQIIIVIAPKPVISWPLLDSYLIMADYFKLTPCIVLNKTDLECTSLKHSLLQQYAPLGYTIIYTGIQEQKGNQDLKELLKNQTSVFVGQSGVGKSSLISSMHPQGSNNIQTTALSTISELGCHTTRNSCLYHLSEGGSIIDSPGVRELHLWHMKAQEIASFYREFNPLISLCKYRNCDHQNTPGCGIIEALNKNKISEARYKNYVKIVEQFTKQN